MIEALVSGILVQLAKIAADEAKEHVKLLTNVKKEVKKIEVNLRSIRVVLEDAEEKEFDAKQKLLQIWLNSLKEQAFLIEDVLDDCKVALLTLRRDKDGALKAKVLSCISLCFHPNQGVERYQIASRIKEINSSLDEIANQRDRYGLAAKPERKQPRRVESTTFDVDVSNVHGRDDIRDDIIQCLLSESDEEGSAVKTISVLGMGGVGKTTLAQLIYRHDRIKEQFGDNRVWVCVSDYFNLRNVALAIIEGLERQMIPSSDQSQLEQLLQRISRSIKEKKFFLVLDDVWEHDMNKWRSLINALKLGATGSRILLTTRKNMVAKMLNYSHVFPLSELSADYCWMILSQLAFDGRDEKERAELEGIGKAISNRCKGLPLAAITLGNLLRSKSSKEEWESILNSEIWKLNVAEEQIFTLLLLSYYDLPSPIRRCFRFCVLKMKDALYSKDDVIYQWASQGYLELDGNANLELTGEEYFNFLASRSFFQRVRTNYKAIVEFRIHDIVHDFGQYLSKDDIVTKEVKHGENLIIDLSSRIRHLSLFSAKGNNSPISVNGAEKLHTLHSTRWLNETSLRDIFNRAKQLRMICLDHGFKGQLSVPEEIGDLIHLNHLSFTKIQFKTLPKSMSKLCNLQYLKIRQNHSLVGLPCWIGEFVGLRSLGTLGSAMISKFPKSIVRLANLTELIGIIVSADTDDPNEFTLGDLEKMDQLRRLWIELKGSHIHAGEVVRAKFDNKIHLNDFRIFSSQMNGSTDYVIQALSLPSRFNLRFFDTILFGNRV